MPRERFDSSRIDWPSALMRVGVADWILQRPHTSKKCPFHPENGKTKFRFLKPLAVGRWVCNDCGTGDGIDLLQRLYGWSFVEAAGAVNGCAITRKREASAQLSVTEMAAAKKLREQRFNTMRTWWKQAKTIDRVTPASRYLKNRVPRIALAALGGDLRGHAGLAFFVEGLESGSYEKQGSWPALLALFRDSAGSVKMMHRIFLDRDGHKAPFDNVKKMYVPEWVNGTAVRIGDDTQTVRRVIGVTEGIETGVAVFTSVCGRFPVWAAGSAHNVAHLEVPDDVEYVHIFADNNQPRPEHRKGVGLEAAETLSDRLLAQGKKVTIHLPKKVGDDFADEWIELCALREKHAA